MMNKIYVNRESELVIVKNFLRDDLIMELFFRHLKFESRQPSGLKEKNHALVVCCTHHLISFNTGVRVWKFFPHWTFGVFLGRLNRTRKRDVCHTILCFTETSQKILIKTPFGSGIKGGLAKCKKFSSRKEGKFAKKKKKLHLNKITALWLTKFEVICFISRLNYFF